jgi:hypothetical protein
MLVELAGVVVYGMHDDVPAARLLARRDRAGKGVVQQDPAEAGVAQLPGQGVAGEQDGGDLPGIAAAEAAGKVSVLDQVRCDLKRGLVTPFGPQQTARARRPCAVARWQRAGRSRHPQDERSNPKARAHWAAEPSICDLRSSRGTGPFGLIDFDLLRVCDRHITEG